MVSLFFGAYVCEPNKTTGAHSIPHTAHNAKGELGSGLCYGRLQGGMCNVRHKYFHRAIFFHPSIFDSYGMLNQYSGLCKNKDIIGILVPA